ncbi:MAG: ComEC/Rec2 family competence protein [Candidatus Aceula meridiana]|nr:ComEC/Rec2 family competence protein [Candidatus Aceula meridiana]
MKSRRPLISIVAFFILGIILQSYFQVSFAVIASAAGVILLASLIFFKRRGVSTIFILFAFLFLGALLLKNVQILSKQDISKVARFYKGKTAAIEGVVVSDIEERLFYKTKKMSFVFEVNRLKTKWGWRNKKGRILVHVFGERDIAYGDVLRLEGKLYKAFNFKTDNRFSYRDYLERKGIRNILSVKKQGLLEILEQNKGNPLKAFAIHLKNRAKNIFDENLTPNESALMQAIILGDRYQIPKHIRELFVVTGTAHILAISGLHVGIVAFLIFLFLKLLPIGQKSRVFLTILILIFYAFLTGARPSVVRSTVMATVFLSSLLIEKETDLINSLCLAALLILFFNPLTLFDVGFQLSFVSVFFIILFYPPIKNMVIQKKDLPRFSKRILQALSVSLAAWLGVAGLIAYYFQTISPVTIFANLFVIPCISVVVALGLGLLFAGAFLPFVAFAFAVCLEVSLNMMTAVVYLFSKVPGASFALPQIPAYFIWAYYLIVCAIFLFLTRLHRKISH